MSNNYKKGVNEPAKSSKMIELGKKLNQRADQRALQNNIEHIAMRTGTATDLKKSKATKGGIIITTFFIIIAGLVFWLVPRENEVIGHFYGFEIVDRWAIYMLAVVGLIIQSILKIRKAHRYLDGKEGN